MKLVTRRSTRTVTDVDMRRRMLATTAVRLMAACTGAMPLFAAVSCQAADKPKSFIDIRVGDMPAGTIRTFEWRGGSFVIVRTTREMLADLRAQTSHAWSEHRIADRRPAFFVLSRWSSTSGCLVVHAHRGAARYAPKRLWQGGFYDPCPRVSSSAPSAAARRRSRCAAACPRRHSCRSPSAAGPAVDREGLTPLLLLFGSNTGSGEAFAQRIASDAAAQGYAAQVAPLDDHAGSCRPTARWIVAASYEGQPPDNARQFIAWIEALPRRCA